MTSVGDHCSKQIAGRGAAFQQRDGVDAFQDSPMARVKEGCAGVQQVCDPDRPAFIRLPAVAGAIMGTGTGVRRMRGKEASVLPVLPVLHRDGSLQFSRRTG